ncbi:MAG: hypothetical protein ABMB14_16155 [Myxococcota bacterium]
MFRPLAFTVLLSGCSFVGIDLEGVEDAVSGITDPVVEQGLVLGIEDPDIKELEPLVKAGIITPGVTVSVFLANAADAANIQQAPMNGARVVLELEDGESFDAPRVGEGTYTLDVGANDIQYVEEDIWTLWADSGRETASWIDVILPPAADPHLPDSHDTNTALDLDFTGQGFHSAIVMVNDGLGIPTWTNYPTSITDIYNQSLASDPLELLTIPEGAFPRKGTYAIGVAAMVHNDDGQLGEVNKLLSRGMSGKMTWSKLEVK